MNKEDIKIGQVVYKEEHWSQAIFSAKVRKITETGVELDGLFYVNPDGSKAETFYGSTGGKFEDIFATGRSISGERAKVS